MTMTRKQINMIKSHTVDSIEMGVFAGDSIGNTCKEAVSMCAASGKNVWFDFNGVKVEVTPSTTSEQALQFWNTEFERRRDEYRRSPEYKEYQRKAKERANLAQQKINSLILKFPDALKTQQRLCKWFDEFTEPADHCDVTYDAAFIIKNVEDAGYTANMCCVDDSMSEDAKKTHKKLLGSSRIMFGNYLIGQALSCMKKGMGPHPVFRTFYSRDYLKLVAEEKGQ
jgi:hypothetical protein